ncbi:hypothetical protein IJJ54_00145 [Candidatus Saccharibacteria bacterium]|nr:hypothetical protein [Candidatus Saccharibacteria bacterium]
MAQQKRLNRKKLKSNKKREQLRLFALAGLAVVALFMAIGFAAYTQTLNINGTVSVGSASWKVKWDASSFSDPQNRTSSHSVTDSTVTVTCNDLQVGKAYGLSEGTCFFYVDAINEGTYDAKLSTITISGLSAAQQKYMVVQVYDDVNTPLEFNYSTNASYAGATSPSVVTVGTAKNVSSDNVILSKQSSKEFCIEISTFPPANSADLPSSSQNVTITIALKWDQV